MKFISILGYDRSGTTFLGEYISHYGKNIFFAGEIDKGIENYSSGLNIQCSCGKLMRDCPVWGEIFKEPGVKKLEIDSVLQKIKLITGADVIIDSSKSLSYVKEFRRIFGKDHLTIHITRDPKGVAYSRLKIRKRRVGQGKHPKPQIASNYNLMMIYDCFQWSYKNSWIELFKDENRNLNLTYEKLKTELPEKLIEFYKVNDIDTGENLTNNHVIYGDKGRLNFNKNIIINNSWKGNLTYAQIFLVNFITFPVRKFFGYNFTRHIKANSHRK